MKLADLRLAPPGAPCWDSRLEEIAGVAIAMAWAARPADTRATCSVELWSTLSAGARGAWFILAARGVGAVA